MLEQLRKDHNTRRGDGDPKLTILPFVMKAVCASMRRYPAFNASFDHGNNEIIYKDYFNFGIAVDTPAGLVVPVVRDVDRKNVFEVARALEDVSDRARRRRLRLEELQGGCISISSLGGIGGTAFTPIVNAPEVAVLCTVATC